MWKGPRNVRHRKNFFPRYFSDTLQGNRHAFVSGLKDEDEILRSD